MSGKFKSAVQRALEVELLPHLRDVGEEAEARLRRRLEVELPELAVRITSTASAPDRDDAMLEALAKVPELWFEQERVRLEAEKAALMRATVRATFGVLFELLAA